MDHFSSAIFILFLIMLNASFVAAEFAIARIRRTLIDHIANSKPDEYPPRKIKTAKLLQKITRNINDYISACQVGITISSLALGAVSEAKIAKVIAPMMEEAGFNINAHAVSSFIAIGIITFFHVILGEVVPKNISIINPEKVAFAFAYHLRFLYLVFKFPVIMLNACSNLLLKMFGIESNFNDNAHSEAELKLLLSSSQAQGVLEKEEEQLMQNVFEFNDTIAREVMIPRSDMFCFNANMSIEEAGKVANQTTFSRFPVFLNRIDNIIGYFNIKDVLKAYQEGQIRDNIQTITSEVLKVSDGIYIIDLLKLMQENKKQIAVLIDEFGGVSGLVTAEDIVEELFGDIDDEDDIDEEQPIERLANGDFLVDGLLHLDDLNDELGTNLKSEIYDTIGGFVFGLIGTEPEEGAEVEFNGTKFRVEEHENNRVRKVRIISQVKKV